MKFGIDRLIGEPTLRAPLAGRRVALLAHPASVTADLTHSLDALAGVRRHQADRRLRAAARAARRQAGQHGRVARLSPIRCTASRSSACTAKCAGRPDADDGARSTSCWSICRTSAAASTRSSRRCSTCWRRRPSVGKSGVGARPAQSGRPAGRRLTLREGWESFVGAGPHADAPWAHARRARARGSSNNSSSTSSIASSRCEGWQPDAAPGFGWPLGERTWVNPSPNAPNLFMARAYAGTVMLEGTTLSEGRGTTRPLELFGAPDIDARAVIDEMQRARAAVAARLPPARLLVRADVPQACRQAVQRRADPHRGSRLRPRGVQALARAGASLQGDPPPLSRLSAVARFSLRVRISASSRSTSSTAARCCANGSTIRARRRPISMR